MVSLALLSVGVTLGMNFVGEQSKGRDTRTKQSMHRYIAIQVTQHITGNLAFFPPIEPVNSSDKIVYYGCMTKEGILINNKFTFMVMPSFDKSVSTGLCPTDKTLYEVRYYWLPMDPNAQDPNTDEVEINLLTLQQGTPKSLSVRNFKIFAK